MDSVSHIKSIFSTVNLKSRGLCPVSSSTSPHKLYYEIHGPRQSSAPRLLFIMGLNNSCYAWSNQIEGLSAKYEMVVFDNRGVGHSGLPFGKRFYSTSEMAQDTKELLDTLGWNEDRGFAVIGISMGGMIAMELAKLIPERIHSLVITSSHSGNTRKLPSLKATYMFGRLMTTVWTPEQGISLIVDTLFPSSYLDVPNDKFGTKRKAVEKDFMYRYEIGARQSFSGRVGQMAAVFGHHVSTTQLKEIAKAIPKIAIITGDQDSLIHFSASIQLHKELPGSELKIVKGGGHALTSQIADEYNDWVDRVVQEGIQLSKK